MLLFLKKKCQLQNRMMSRVQIVGSIVMLTTIALCVWYITAKQQQSSPPSSSLALQQQHLVPDSPMTTPAPTPFFFNTDPPEYKINEFAFEPLTMPGFVPNDKASMAKKPAGVAPYKLVNCTDDSYAIRWNGRYLTIIDPNRLEWTETKSEPESCFTIVPGYCNNTHYVMLRSVANKLFLKPDEVSKALVVRDTPTARTASSYCWKLLPDLEATKRPCGCVFSSDLGRVVCTPCDLHEMPKQPGESCSTVTAGFQAQCCLRKTPEQRVQDAFCGTAAWPETIGRTVQEAMLYIRTRRPDLTLRPCPAPCTVTAYPEPQPQSVIIPYDARSGLVVSAPLRLV